MLAYVLVNQTKPKEIGLFDRSCKDALAPTLYVFKTKVLSYLLYLQKSCHLIKGIPIHSPPKSQMVNGNFIDNSFLTILEEQKPTIHTMNHIQIFNVASQYKLKKKIATVNSPCKVGLGFNLDKFHVFSNSLCNDNEQDCQVDCKSSTFSNPIKYLIQDFGCHPCVLLFLLGALHYNRSKASDATANFP